MNSSKLPLVAVLIVLMGATVFFLIGGGGGDAPTGQLPVTELPDEPDVGLEANTADRQSAAGVREAVSSVIGEPAAADATMDPELRAEMAGFVGRVLHHDGKPAAETKVSLFHFDPASIIGEIEDILSEEIIDPDVDAGDAVTDAEGRFEIHGVWPRALYLMYAGVDSENPTTVIIERTPANRETIDLGDIHLRDGAVVTGLVVDDDDVPIAGALVRVVDLPAQILQMVPIERLDPEGALIMKERSTKVVVKMPAWAKRRFDQLPLPTTRTAEDGSFRVTGIEAGNNHIVVVTKAGRLSAMRPGISLRAGAEKDVGRVRVGLGEEVFGTVVDAAGEPVPGAEVLVAQGGAVTEVSFAGPALRTAGDGSFTTAGFKPGKVIAAARRHPGDPWVINDPQSVMRDLAIVLPEGVNLTIRLASKAGRPIDEPELELLTGRAGNGAVVLKRFGLTQPVKIKSRQQQLEDGRYHFAGLPAGQYTLLARAPGHALSGQRIDLKTSQEITMQLEPESGLMVRVTERSGKPVRSVAIYVEPRGNRRQELGDMPINCGRTSADGRLAAGGIPPGKVRISARHPRYGWVHAEARLPGPEVHLTYAEPGAMEGVLTENGQIPKLGKWTIAANRERSQGRGAMPEMPRLTAPNAEGAFSIQGMQPGDYTLFPIDSLSKDNTPGSFMQNMMMAGRMVNSEEVHYTIVSGQTTHVTLDTEPHPGVVDGPSARITGTVIINGQPGVGMKISGWGNTQVSSAVDAAGRFDLGQVRVGHLYLQVIDPDSSDLISRGQLWSKSLQIEENKDQNIEISLDTSTLAGRVTNPDGTAATGAQVRLSGSVGADGAASANFHSITDEQGQYLFAKIPAGQFNVRAEHEENGQGWVDPVVVTAGHHRIDVQLAATVSVSGHVDRRVFGEKVSRLWLTFVGEKGSQNQNWIGVESDGSFVIDRLIPGTYRARIYANFNGASSKEYVHDGPIQVGPAGLQGLTLNMKVVEQK